MITSLSQIVETHKRYASIVKATIYWRSLGCFFCMLTHHVFVDSTFRWVFPKVLKCLTFSRIMWQELPYWMTLNFTKAARRYCRRRKQGNLCPIPVYRSALHCNLIPRLLNIVLIDSHFSFLIWLTMGTLDVRIWLWDLIGIIVLGVGILLLYLINA